MLFEQILSLIPCAVFWKDRDGFFQGCNHAFLAWAGITDKSQLVGKTDKELSWSDRWEEYSNDDQYVITSGKTIARIEEVSLSNKKITCHTSKTPWMKDGERVGILGVIYDISELVEAKEKAVIANHLKSEFIQNMQHDIRTPASGIWAVLSDMVDEETDSPKKQKLTLLRNSAKQLFDICNDVIDFEKAERGEIPVTSQKLQVAELIKKVIDLNQPIASKKNLSLSYFLDKEIPSMLKGDPHRLIRILINLVGNAIKFTSDGKVEVRAKLLRMQDKEVLIQFEIHDTGIGIPEDKINLIYEKFSRGTRSNSNMYTGSGLGLQLVKKFVADLNGEIDVHSMIGKGSVFYINIPFEIPLVAKIYDESSDFSTDTIVEEKTTKITNATTNNMPQENPPSTNCNIKVLLIEDDHLAQIATSNLIKSAGHQLVLVDNVKKALDILDREIFDWVICDIGLPDGTGFDIIRAVKKNPQSLNYNAQFLTLTAHSDQSQQKEAERSGFYLMISKPLLREQVNTLFNENSNRQSPKTQSK